MFWTWAEAQGEPKESKLGNLLILLMTSKF